MATTLNKVLLGGSKILLPQYDYYAKTVILNSLKRFTSSQKVNKYLFILSAPLSGSTLLNEILATSQNVSSNNEWGTREGQKLPTTRKMMFDHDHRWDNTVGFDWSFIRQEWRKYWDTTKPILLEKSPPNIIRAKAIQEAFEPAYFLILVRNPYAQCEGLIRRKNETPKRAAQLVLERMNIQKANDKQLKNKLLIPYELLCDQTAEVVAELQSLLPEIGSLATERTFRSHNIHDKKLPIQNLNDVKISALTKNQLQEINTVFENDKAVFDYFNYALIN